MIFSCFTYKLKEKAGGLLGGPKGMLAPLQNYWGGGGLAPPGPPLPTPMDNEAFQNEFPAKGIRQETDHPGGASVVVL